ncbi:MAG: polyphosphate:AMP phosphotransferase [Rhodospirillales bacterium]
MFRTAELGRTVPKEEYHERAPTLREGLLEAQQELKAAPFPVIIVFGGVDKGGKIETVNLLSEWLDPRWLVTRAYGVPSDEMAERPEYWRYWRDLPPKGRIGLFIRCWYSLPLLDRAHGRSNEAEFDEALDRIVAFENCLADDGALILKFWMHLGKKQQKIRLSELEKNPLTRWRVTQTDWDHWHMYDDFIGGAERLLMRTSTGKAPWQIVEGFDKRYSGLTVGQAVLQGIRRHLDETELSGRLRAEVTLRRGKAQASGEDRATAGQGSATVVEMPRVTILDRLDMSATVDKKTYGKRLEKLQCGLYQECLRANELGVSTICVFEGWDAAGKGGAIRRITAALDARNYQVIPFAAPTDEERAQHYLWRFWRHLSRAGRMNLYDRSWYGRVLVERVEGFATEAEWRRAYAEINDFEDQLVRHGIVLCKFWIHITADEQLARFKQREGIPYKRWKLTDEDWRNRDRWAEYELAVNDMVERTSTKQAPWTLVEGNDKRFARLKVLETVVARLKAGLGATEQSGLKALKLNKVGRSA